MALPRVTTTLAELDGWWIELRCCRIVFYPCRLLAQERGGHRQVGLIARRMRCRRCGGLPAALALTNDAAGGIRGTGAPAPSYRRIPLD